MRIPRLTPLARPWALALALAAALAANARGQTAPTANFQFDPALPVIGTVVNFTDTSEGAPTSWLWNFGDPASGVSNTSNLQNPSHAFLIAGEYVVTLTATNESGNSTVTKTVTASNSGGTPCVADDVTLCLHLGRFAVSADWEKPDGTTGHGTAVSLTDESGYFWFFGPDNIELVVKVLNGCSIDNAYWVFAAGLTNVRVRITGIDTQTGLSIVKENPQGQAFVPIQDTAAFTGSCP